jgi:hypothetical protein
MKEEGQNSLKELIPKMGPRLKLKQAIEETYAHEKQNTECEVNFSTVTSSTATTSTGNIALKGQMKLQVGADGWNLKRLSEKVLL